MVRGAAVADSVRRALAAAAPPTSRTVRAWADAKRRLSPENTREHGQWRTDRVPYLAEPMEVVTDPGFHTIVWMTSTQTAKTEFVLNVTGYYIDEDPSPILVVLPTVIAAEDWSKERLALMLRDTPALQGKVREAKGRDSDNRILQKVFPGGRLTLVGANSPVGLAMRSIRILLADEVDKFAASAGKEGDPLRLAERRQATYLGSWKRVLTSSPTIKGFSRIERAWKASDMRRYRVPCPNCGFEACLTWRGSLQDARREARDVAGAQHYVAWDERRTETARLQCASCHLPWTEAQRKAAVEAGRWEPTSTSKGIAGFHLNELYSPWLDLPSMVEDWLEATDALKAGDPTLLIAFINTRLGECWEDAGAKIEAHELLERREPFPADHVPLGVALLTAGIDVQTDRLEVEIVGWGLGNESWSLAFHRLEGDPAEPGVWEDLDRLLVKPFRHASGQPLYIRGACLDTGGDHTAAAYRFARDRFRRRLPTGQKTWLFAVKGRAGDRLIWPRAVSRAKKATEAGVQLYIVGVDTAKDLVANRLRLQIDGPGYCHYPLDDRPEDFFKQLTAERRTVRWVKGEPRRAWVKDPPHARNEALDLRVYATAAEVGLRTLGVTVEKEAARLPRVDGDPTPPAPTPRRRRRRRVVRRFRGM